MVPSPPTTREVVINDAPLSSPKTTQSSPTTFCDEVVTKTVSSWNERHWLRMVTKRPFFVTDVFSINDETCIVTERISFYDERFSSPMFPVFVITYRSVRLPNGVCYAGSWRVPPRGSDVADDWTDTCRWVYWHVSLAVAADAVVTWWMTWPVDRMSTCHLLWGPRGILWLFNVSRCCSFSFSSQNSIWSHHRTKYTIVTKTTFLLRWSVWFH